jgi:peptide/nickel transport system substrate-binding protein
MKHKRLVVIVGILALASLTAPTPAAAQVPKPGGVLRLMQQEDPPAGFAIHESASINAVWAAMPCFSNLVIFDPLKKRESTETVIGELAEKWSWQDNYRNLVFFLRRNVKWHDGKPFTSTDVKFTFDIVREAPEAQAKLRMNARKDWYANVEAIEAPEPFTVVFRLRRPQPSLLLMLASGYSPVYAAHLPPSSYRTGCIGTGPFKLKEWKRGESIEYVKNPDYFISGRPYLDGLRYVVIVDRGTRFAALQAGQLDAGFPFDTSKTIAEQVTKAEPRIKMTVAHQNLTDNLTLNTTRPPFNNPKARLAMTLAIDRKAYARAVHQGGAIPGAALAPRPWGVWGLPEKDLAALPGFGDKPQENKARAKKLLAEAGYGASNPLKVEMLTRNTPAFLDFAGFVVDELKHVGVQGSIKLVELAQLQPMAARKEYTFAPYITGTGIDDPDANFFENYGCASPRNYTGYCDERVAKMIEQQSQELDPQKRMALVWDIQKRLEEAAARPIVGWRLEHYLQWQHVKNLIPHQSIYNWARMQEVWLDR